MGFFMTSHDMCSMPHTFQSHRYCCPTFVIACFEPRFPSKEFAEGLDQFPRVWVCLRRGLNVGALRDTKHALKRRAGDP